MSIVLVGRGEVTLLYRFIQDEASGWKVDLHTSRHSALIFSASSPLPK
jgi:hypothetical protein